MSLVNAAMICGDSRDRLTEQAIRSFYAHTDLTKCDLTVALDNTNEDTTKLVEMLRTTFGFNLVVIRPSQGGGFITNLAIHTATGCELTLGEFIYHTAADFYFKPGWLEALFAAWPIAESEGVGLLGAYSHPYHQDVRRITRDGVTLCIKDMVAGGSWFIRRETWERFGPLNTRSRGNYVGSEDTEFNFRLIKAGVGRATIWPEMVVHTGRTNASGQPTLGAEWMTQEYPGVLIE